MKPSNFTTYPWSSVLQNSESETIALNVMKILARTGNEFRELSYEEYKSERLKDSNFTDKEQSYFEKIILYCKTADTAILFSKSWVSV